MKNRAIFEKMIACREVANAVDVAIGDLERTCESFQDERAFTIDEAIAAATRIRASCLAMIQLTDELIKLVTPLADDSPFDDDDPFDANTWGNVLVELKNANDSAKALQSVVYFDLRARDTKRTIWHVNSERSKRDISFDNRLLNACNWFEKEIQAVIVSLESDCVAAQSPVNVHRQLMQLQVVAKALDGVIGSIFVMPRELARTLLPELLARLNPEHFYDEGHGKLFAVLRKLVTDDKPVDPTLFVAAIKAAGIYEEVGGSAYISKIINAVPNAAHAVYYAEIVLDKAYARRVIVESTRILQAAYDGTTTAEELATLVESANHRISSDRSAAEMPNRLADSLRRMLSDLRKPVAAKATSRAYFGIAKADELVGPIHAGEVCVVAARPGMGKTAFGAYPVRFAAENKSPSLLISLEMEDREIAGREASRGTRIDNRFFRNGDLDDQDLADLDAFTRSTDDLPYYTWAPATASLSQIRAMMIQAKNRLGITVAAIDYIGLVAEPPRWQGKRRDHLAEVSRGLNKLAKELQIPLFVMCQLNREKERPNLTMLAECGAIEQDADCVIFLHADSTDDNYREVIVAKFRAGQTGAFKIGWEGSRFSFGD